jgi:hypothetical protein
MAAVSNEREIGRAKKNSRQEIVVSTGEFNGRWYIYVLAYEIGEPLSAEHHSGLTMTPSTAKELLPLLREAAEIAEAEDARGRRR